MGGGGKPNHEKRGGGKFFVRAQQRGVARIFAARAGAGGRHPGGRGRRRVRERPAPMDEHAQLEGELSGGARARVWRAPRGGRERGAQLEKGGPRGEREGGGARP